MRNAIERRWSHADTMIVGRDLEIAVMRPPDLFAMLLNIFSILDTYHQTKCMLLNASGRIELEEATLIPKDAVGGAVRIARIWAGKARSRLNAKWPKRAL